MHSRRPRQSLVELRRFHFLPPLVAFWLLAMGSPTLADPPLASDFDLNPVPLNTVLTAESADIVGSFASDVDEGLLATSLTFNSATIDGSPVASPAVAGFSYTPGVGTAGAFTVDPTVGAFAGLTPGTSAIVVVSFTVTDSDLSSDTGELRYTVAGDPGPYDELTFDFQGPPAAGLAASRTAGANETLASIVMAGPGTLASAMAGFDFSMIDPPAASPGGEFAIAIAANDSIADAIAENGSVATADAGTDSDAWAFAEVNSRATATSRDDGSAASSAVKDASATSFASEGSTAVAASSDAAIAQAVALDGSVANAATQDGSDSLAFARAASAASANASGESSATSTAEAGSASTSTANLESTTLAFSNDASLASATANSGFLATSESNNGGKGSVFSSALVANPRLDDNGPDDATLRLPEQFNASADTLNALFFEVAGSGGAVNRVVLSGFPASTTLSAGTEESSGVWAFTGPPQPDLTFALPVGWTDAFELEVMVEIANDRGAVRTSMLVNLGMIFSDGFED